MLLIAGCLLPLAHAGILAPEWSRPLTSPVISASARPKEDGTEELFLLLADRRVMVVSLLDSLTELGRAPEGTTALVALPWVGGGADAPGTGGDDDAALLLAARGGAGSCHIVAWNRRGQPLWDCLLTIVNRQLPVANSLSGIDSMAFIAWHEDRAELCAWQRGEPWLVVAGSDQVRATRLLPGFVPLDALIVDINGDGVPELVFCDGRQFAVFYTRQNRELRCEWPGSPTTNGQEPGTRDLVACAVFDSVPVLLVLTGDTLRYVDALTGAEQQRLAHDRGSGVGVQGSGPRPPAPDPWSPSDRGLPGFPRAVCASGPAAYVAGADRQGRGYVVALDASGSARPRLRLPPSNYACGLALLKDWPMVLVNVGHGPQNLFIYPPSLAGADANSPGYSGARLLRVLPLRLDDDTFPDLVVLRTAADARWRVDAFTNRLGLLTRELDQARQALQRAALGSDGNEVIRASRRVELLAAAIGPGAASPEARLLRRHWLAARRRNDVIYLWGLLAFCLAAGLAVLAAFVKRRRAGPSGRQIESKPLPTSGALAAELIAVDHNFISKGNTPAAIERLTEIRNRHGLTHDRDLARLSQLATRNSQLADIYTSAVFRLIDSTPTLALLDFIETTARSAPRGRDIETLELRQEDLRRRERGPGIRLICAANHEYPDCYRRFRLFSSPEVRGTLEHIILDHIRHAGAWADIVLSYAINTQWNRRLLIRLLSDSPRVIPLADPRAHITSQLLDLASLLGPAIEIPAADSPFASPHEKLWLKIADYISVLEETRTRLSTP